MVNRLTDENGKFKKRDIKEKELEDKKIIRLFNSGKNGVEIGNILNLSNFKVYNILKENNLSRKPPKKENGWILCSCGCGGKLLKYSKYGKERMFIVSHQLRGNDAPNKRNDIREKTNEIIRLYKDELMSTKEIGKLFGCSGVTITRILRKNNVLMTNSERRINLFKGNKMKAYNKINFTKEQEIEIIRLYKEELINTENIGKIFGCSEEPIIKVLKKNKIFMNTVERRKELSKANKIKVWNDGLTKETDDRVKNNVVNLIIKNKLAIGKKYEEIYGEKRAKNIKEKISVGNSIAKIGEKNSMFGKTQTKKWMEMRKNLKIPFKDSKIEVKIQEFLTKLHLEYFSHKYISEISHAYQCDILIPEQIKIYENGDIIEIKQKTIIECDGCYWHGCKICNKKINEFQDEQIEEDKIRTQELIENGFKVIRLWEHKIKKIDINEFSKMVLHN